MYANDLNPASYQYLCTNIKVNRVGGKVLPFNMDGRQFMRLAAGGQLDVAAAAAVVPPAAPKAKPGQQQKPGQHGEQQQQRQQRQEAQQPPPAGQASAPAGAGQQQQQQEQHAAGTAGAAADGSGRFQHIVMNLPAAAVDFLDALMGAFSPELWEGHPLPLVHVYTFTKGEEELAGAPAARLPMHGCRPEQTAQPHACQQGAAQQPDTSSCACCGTLTGTLNVALPAGLPFPRPASCAAAGLRQRVEASLGGLLDDEPQLHVVRDVAPKKLMVEVTFRVPASIAFAAAATPTAATEEPAKRQRVD